MGRILSPARASRPRRPGYAVARKLAPAAAWGAPAWITGAGAPTLPRNAPDADDECAAIFATAALGPVGSTFSPRAHQHNSEISMNVCGRHSKGGCFMRSAALVLLTSALAASVASAQITMDRVLVGVPAGTMSGGTVTMDLAISQPAVGPSIGGSIKSDLGFWWQVVSLTADAPHDSAPAEFALHRTAPNPFSTRTAITYAIPRGPVSVFVGIFNLQGGLVRTLVSESQSPGTFTVTWDGCDDNGKYLPAGVYFTKIRAGSNERSTKTVMLK